ncbi:ABC transporter permease subunit [Merdimonas faecis]|uniref:ABC transporter permease subunit n=1 Tax=Merdimonas faecis TaxID=1653435 RepID=UPI0022E868BC|nr:ABC transporter permease subunit [Merdimonas faecis]
MIKLMLKFELKKIFSKRINQVLLAAVLVVTIIYSGMAIGSMSYTDEEGQDHTGIEAGRLLAADKNQWKGDLTPETISQVIKEYKELSAKYPDGIPDTEYGKSVQSYYDIYDFVIGIMTPDSEWNESVVYQLSDEQLQDIYTIYQDNMKKMAEEYGTTPEKRSYLESIYEKIEIPLTFEAKDSWDTMTMYAQTYVLLMAVIIGFLVAGIFSGEFRPGTEDVFLAAKYGRSKAIKNKIIAGILVSTVVYWIGVGILSFISFAVMGTSGFFTPYQIDDPYSIYVMTYGEYYLLILVGGYIATMFCAALTMLVTVKMHTPNLAVCIPFFLLCMMPFIARVLPTFDAFFNLLPTVLTNIFNAVRTPILFQIGPFVFRQISFLMFLYIVLFIVLLPFIYRSYSRYGIKKKIKF